MARQMKTHINGDQLLNDRRSWPPNWWVLRIHRKISWGMPCEIQTGGAAEAEGAGPLKKSRPISNAWVYETREAVGVH